MFSRFRRKKEQAPQLPPGDELLLIVGLGNPGAKYAHTRHNVGYKVVGLLSKRHAIELSHSGVASVGLGRIVQQDVVLARPRTFMNKSGDAIRALVDRFRVPPENLLIVYDDLDLPVGQVRLRLKGGSGGNRGMGSIIQRVGSANFKRLRIGISRPYVEGEPVYEPNAIGDWVLSPPDETDAQLLEDAVERAVEAIELAISEGFEMAMNRFNRNPAPAAD
ncbi:MAG TPA: aminoacyl-tRNA hydrolase [Dehalococcoidia bacterium]|nr:aminoacyl-tRNA hydrolase [Dehalococcoidia bacterium]